VFIDFGTELTTEEDNKFTGWYDEKKLHKLSKYRALARKLPYIKKDLQLLSRVDLAMIAFLLSIPVMELDNKTEFGLITEIVKKQKKLRKRLNTKMGRK
jgi:hypothetical protein